MSSVTVKPQSSQAVEGAETDIVLAVSDLHKTYYQGSARCIFCAV
jgi:hypothetical protein